MASEAPINHCHQPFPDLEKACWICGGTGKVDGSSTCPECEGEKVFPTDFGKAVLRLVAHNLRLGGVALQD